MVFNSEEFLIFFLLVFCIFWFLPKQYRPLFILCASYFFYGFLEPILVLLLLGVTVASYFIAILISKESRQSIKKIYLFIGISILILPLLYFKYSNFIFGNINTVINTDIPRFDIILPVGISFYTFQTASYLIDVYRLSLKPCYNFIAFAIYVAFFPQLVAGPIERVHNLLPQLSGENAFHLKSYKTKNFVFGIKMVGWGLLKKIVIADRLAKFVDPIYNNVTDASAQSLILATLFFAFQIYCDFSGYSDIAIGIARFFGVSLMKNFNKPYFSKSIFEFWRRWHISLSSWFKDYIYLPLGGSKVGFSQWCFNILLVFIISGLWHGAQWTFIVWGFLHGISMIVAKILSPYYSFIEKQLESCGLKDAVNLSLTFVFVNITWVFFRANSLSDSILILKKIFTEIQFELDFSSLMLTPFIMVVILIAMDWNQGQGFFPALFNAKNKLARNIFYYLMATALIFFGFYGKSPFIYFQF